MRQLFKSRKYTPEVFDLVDETLDQMAFFVQVFVIISRLLSIASGGYNHLAALLKQGIQKWLGIISFVGNQHFKLVSFNQFLGLSDVVTFATGQTKAQRVAEGVHAHVNLGAEPAPAASKRLFPVFLGAPAAQGWARMMVLSIINHSMSGSLAKC